jgi:hypothetical protein
VFDTAWTIAVMAVWISGGSEGQAWTTSVKAVVEIPSVDPSEAA